VPLTTRDQHVWSGIAITIRPGNLVEKIRGLELTDGLHHRISYKDLHVSSRVSDCSYTYLLGHNVAATVRDEARLGASSTFEFSVRAEVH
jgi:hypothetical protein